jgi:hypothetical protein
MAKKQDPAWRKWEDQMNLLDPLYRYHLMCERWGESGFPLIYIGNRKGEGEISMDSDRDEQCWCYNFDMNAFQEQSYQELIRFMEVGLEMNPHPRFQKENLAILNKLKSIPKEWFGHCHDPIRAAEIFAEGQARK